MRQLLIIFLILSLSGCRTRKVEQHKKVEKVNEMVQNDVRLENDIQTSTEINRVRNDVSFSVEPLDPDKPSRVSYKGDTLDLQNAKLVFGKSQESEKTEQDLQDHSKTTDNSSRKTDSVNKEKDRQTETQSASWGLNLGLIFAAIGAVILIYFSFSRPK